LVVFCCCAAILQKKNKKKTSNVTKRIKSSHGVVMQPSASAATSSNSSNNNNNQQHASTTQAATASESPPILNFAQVMPNSSQPTQITESDDEVVEKKKERKKRQPAKAQKKRSAIISTKTQQIRAKKLNNQLQENAMRLNIVPANSNGTSITIMLSHDILAMCLEYIPPFPWLFSYRRVSKHFYAVIDKVVLPGIHTLNLLEYDSTHFMLDSTFHDGKTKAECETKEILEYLNDPVSYQAREPKPLFKFDQIEKVTQYWRPIQVTAAGTIAVKTLKNMGGEFVNSVKHVIMPINSLHHLSFPNCETLSIVYQSSSTCNLLKEKEIKMSIEGITTLNIYNYHENEKGRIKLSETDCLTQVNYIYCSKKPVVNSFNPYEVTISSLKTAKF